MVKQSQEINPTLYYNNLTSSKVKVLYRTGYDFVINNGGTIEEAHQYGLKQISKISKLRNLAQSGKIVKF
jgi:hypothetical protein